MGTQHTRHNPPLHGQPWPKIMLPLQAMLDMSLQWTSTTGNADSLTQPTVGCIDGFNPIDSIKPIYIDMVDDEIKV